MSTIHELEVEFMNAMTALEAYSDEVVAKYRQEYPGPAMAFKRRTAWTLDERAELARPRPRPGDATIKLHDARQASRNRIDPEVTSNQPGSGGR